MTLPEYSCVVLRRTLPDLGLVAGDVDVIVLIHNDAQHLPIGYELEIFSVMGDSIETVGVSLDDVRAATENDRAHARSAA